VLALLAEFTQWAVIGVGGPTGRSLNLGLGFTLGLEQLAQFVLPFAIGFWYYRRGLGSDAWTGARCLSDNH
jgi:hypothetical protein